MEDEQAEIFKRLLTHDEKQDFTDLEKELEEDVVEYASDDERSTADPDYIDCKEIEENSEDEICHDELEPELITEPEVDSSVPKKKPDYMRKHRTEVE